jgi:hypothetical protein
MSGGGVGRGTTEPFWLYLKITVPITAPITAFFKNVGASKAGRQRDAAF